jgi:hypothetical protein
MTPDEIAREVARIRDVDNWPMGDRLPVKRWRGSEYECGLLYAACATSGSPVPVPTVYVDGHPYPTYESIEAMVEAGWIGD